MIKIKDIIKEHKIIMTESFAAGKLRALTNNWRGNDSDFWSYGAKLGIEWNKITDKEIQTSTKPKKKGIEIAYVDKDVTVPVKGKKSWYRGDNFGIDKFTTILVLKDGKPLWYTKGWRPITNVMTATGKTTKRTSYSGPRSKVPDVTAGSRSYSRDKTFGMNELGYQALSSVMKIPGIKFHHISLEEDQPYMGAGVKRQMRQAAQFGAAKFTTNDEFKRINQQYFDELLRAKLNDPKQLQKKLKQAKDLAQKIMDGAIGGVKPTGKIKKLIDMKVGVSSSPEADAYRLASDVGDKLSTLYSEYGYYLKALEKEKEDKIKYGTTDFARSEVESAAKSFQSYWRDIMQFKI
jgi:hypothetical protein|tara:strand:+ start:229 stop:1275 length:1047 start_codon:yes stop_codon:yes gene_type:complete